MLDFVQDLRYGLRMMTKTPVVILVAVASLAVGISANTVTFSVANGFFFKPFPYHNQDELVLVFENYRKDGEDQQVSPANFLDWRERSTVFESLIAYGDAPANLTGGEAPERVRLVTASVDIFELLGREPFLGRGFRSEDAAEGGVVILSNSFWQQQFSSERGVLGSEIVLDGKPYNIIGVMPEDFDIVPANVDLYRPTTWQERINDRTERSLLVMGRLAPGRTVDEAQAELSAIATQLESEYPDDNTGMGARALTLRELFPGPTDTTLMYILLTVAGFVLLIACANIANLLLARAEGRQREVAVRTAMGAGRGRILRQLLTESILLATVSALLGTFLSVYGVRFVATAMPAQLPRAFTPTLDANVLLYTLAAALLAGIIFGIAPALHSFGDDIRESLGENGRGGTATRKRNRLRSSFVVAELAAALALLVGGGVLMTIFDRLIEQSPGFDPNGVLTLQLTASEDRYPEDADVNRFYEDVVSQLSELARVQSVAAMVDLPRSRGVGRIDFTIDGRELPEASGAPTSSWQSVSTSYFEALGVPIVSGRGLSASDRADTERVVVVNESFVDSFFSEEEPLSRHLTIRGTPRRIVGVSANVFQTRMPSEGGKIGPMLYLPMGQQPARNMSLAMRVSGEPDSLAPEVRQAVWAVDPDQPVSSIQTLEEHIATMLSGPRIISLILGVFGGVALLLSSMGIYGVMSHSVVQRRREIGIRMALGAGGDDVVKMVTRQGMKLAGIGVVVGAPLAYAIVRSIRSMLFTDDAISLPFIFTATAVLVAAAFAATYLPALRASRLHPVKALQTE